MTPRPLQRKRTKGFRYPDGVRVLTVTRGTAYGNPYCVIDRTRVTGDWVVMLYGKDYWSCGTKDEALKVSVKLFRERMARIQSDSPVIYAAMMRDIWTADFVACWCDLRMPCHRDVLIELATEWAHRMDE